MTTILQRYLAIHLASRAAHDASTTLAIIDEAPPRVPAEPIIEREPHQRFDNDPVRNRNVRRAQRRSR